MALSKVDWEGIEREYRAGQLTVVEIGRQYCVSHTAINKRAAKEGWTRNLAKAVRDQIRAGLISGESASAKEAVEIAAARGVQIVKSHQRSLSQLSALADVLTERLSQYLDGIQPDGPGVSARESPADMLEKIIRNRHRLIQLERQAFNLDAAADEEDANAGASSVTDRDRAKAVMAIFGRAKAQADAE